MLSLRVQRPLGVASSTAFVQRRGIVGRFNHTPGARPRKHGYNTLPYTHTSLWGGRSSFLREKGPFNSRYRGLRWKRDPELRQFNVDVWCAQQTLRKKWKGRDWEVYELPFEKAPKLLQQVIPEMYTEVPRMADPKNGDFENIRAKVFARENLAQVLFEGTGKSIPALRRVDPTARTLEKFL